MKDFYDEIMTKHKIRFYPKQKQRFREYAIDKFGQMGYENITVDKHKNIIVGNIDTAKYVASAHYDTPPLSFYLTPFTAIFGHIIGLIVSAFVLVLVMIASTMLNSYLGFNFSIIVFMAFVSLFFLPNPSNANDNTSGTVSVLALAQRLRTLENIDEYAFILFNNEELGLIGSGRFVRSFKKRNGGLPNFELYNLDCVALGKKLLIASKNKSITNKKLVTAAKACDMPVSTIKAGILTVASDNILFKNEAMLTGVKRSLIGPFYLPKIHMPNDNKIDEQFMLKIIDIVYSAMTTTTIAE